MSLDVRKVVHQLVETRRENGQPVPGPHRIAIVGVVITNPFPATYVDDVVTIANEVGAELGALVGPACVDLLGGDGTTVEAFGKAALVGIDGELEHGSALIHNLRFGNVFRDAAQGTELLPAAEKVGLPGAPIDVPLKHKLDAKTRSHHQTVTFRIEDAPLPREILVLAAAANGGRPLARLATFGAEVSS
ncbi:amino acid synthesis family protein [Actinopolymorpha alba]|uniref:amino acid synthesis family protein n=1 Tax=Actinopolymorpha alba TaxID=533267 RepID=UPI0003A88C2D|nr:amino acid synthesis family protein [Actinopolymorpha alba]